MTFKFLHAADLHLDSPLLGLASKSADYASRVDRASRDAFENLVALAIDEGCAFVLLAGDLFDGSCGTSKPGCSSSTKCAASRLPASEPS